MHNENNKNKRKNNATAIIQRKDILQGNHIAFENTKTWMGMLRYQRGGLLHFCFSKNGSP